MGGARNVSGKDASKSTRYQVHAIEFPLFTLLGFNTTVSCMNNGFSTIDWALPPTEFLPNWNDEELGFLLAAEAMLYANPVAQMSCGIDCVASSLGNPINEMYWCSGCWGSNYPMTGNIVDPSSAVRNTSLLTSRLLQYNHRMGLLDKTYGKSALCSAGTFAPTIVKDQYKLSMLYPVEEASANGISSQPGGDQSSAGSAVNQSSGKCCHALGEHEMKWGLGRDMPGPGEHHVYTLFRYKQCCLMGI